MTSTVRFTLYPADGDYITGTYGRYYFIASLSAEPCFTAIKYGRVQKLRITDRYSLSYQSEIVNYNKAWLIKPKTQEHKEMCVAIVEALESSTLPMHEIC